MNNKAVIYIRTSTTQQEEQNQLPECQKYCSNKGWEVIGVFQEQLSAYKDIDRPERNKVLELAKQSLVSHVVVWAFDRWVRNRDTLLEDVTIISNYGAKLHSVKEAWLEAVNLDGALGRTLQDFLLGLIGSISEMESQRKSERVKLAVIRKKGSPTMSYKGHKWGRKSISQVAIDKVLELRNAGKTIREIQSEVFYWDKSNNKKQISIGLVHKILKHFANENNIVNG